MKSVPENNYLKTCSTSFPGAQSASFSTLKSLQGVCVAGQQCRVQSAQRQMTNPLASAHL